MGQRKNLSPRQDSNPWPPKHRAGALSTWATDWLTESEAIYLVHFYCSGSLSKHDKQWSCSFVWILTQNLWSCLIICTMVAKTRTVASLRRDNLWKENYKHLFKSSTDSVNRPKLQFYLYNHLEVHSKRCMILRNRRAYSFSNIITGAPGDRHCRCLTKIASNRRSVYGQIENRKPPEHFCLLNKL